MRSMDSNPPSCAPPLPCHPLANGPAAARPPPGGDAARGWKHPPFSPGLNHVPTREPPPRTPAPTPALPPREKDQRPGERGRHGHAHTARVSTPQSPQHPPRLKTPPPAPPTSPTPGPDAGAPLGPRCRGGGGGPWNTPGPPRPPRREDAAIPGASRRGGVTARSGRGPSPGPARRGPVAPPTVRSFAPSRPRPGAAGGRRDSPAAREGPRWGPSARPPPRGPGDTAGRVGHGVGGGGTHPETAPGPRGRGGAGGRRQGPSRGFAGAKAGGRRGRPRGRCERPDYGSWRWRGRRASSPRAPWIGPSGEVCNARTAPRPQPILARTRRSAHAPTPPSSPGWGGLERPGSGWAPAQTLPAPPSEAQRASERERAREVADAPDRRGRGTPTWALREDPSAGERDAPAAVGPGGGVILDAWVLKKGPKPRGAAPGGEGGGMGPPEMRLTPSPKTQDLHHSSYRDCWHEFSRCSPPRTLKRPQARCTPCSVGVRVYEG